MINNFIIKYNKLLNVYQMAYQHIPVNRSDSIYRAVNLIKAGSVAAVPTDTIYGLVCDATNKKAIERLYDIKQRNENKPVAICLGCVSDFVYWVDVSHLPKCLLTTLLPGPVTLILNSIQKLDNSLCHKGKIGIRVPDSKFIISVVNQLGGRPLALTSANISNEPSAIEPSQFKNIWHKLAAVFDDGMIGINRNGSTIIDLSESGMYRIIRKGCAYDNSIKILSKFGLKNKDDIS